MQLTINGLGTTPNILILAIPSRRIHPNIMPHQLVAVCCVICRLFHEVPAFPASSPSFMHYITTDLTVRPLLRLFARSR